MFQENLNKLLAIGNLGDHLPYYNYMSDSCIASEICINKRVYHNFVVNEIEWHKTVQAKFSLEKYRELKEKYSKIKYLNDEVGINVGDKIQKELQRQYKMTVTYNVGFKEPPIQFTSMKVVYRKPKPKRIQDFF